MSYPKTGEEVYVSLNLYNTMLTGIGNRTAFELELKNLEKKLPRPFTIVAYDLNYMKRINDTYGHAAGDAYLRHMAHLLMREEPVSRGLSFRIGGDELVVLCTGISEKEFYQKVEELKTELAAHDVSMAVGAAVNTLEAVGKDHLLTESERRMYQDKAEYYRSTGLDRRKI